MGKLKAIEFEKPSRDENGAFSYSEVLPYLAMLSYKKIPNYKIIWGLASYAMHNNGLTEKQRKIADDFISFFQEEGVI